METLSESVRGVCYLIDLSLQGRVLFEKSTLLSNMPCRLGGKAYLLGCRLRHHCTLPEKLYTLFSSRPPLTADFYSPGYAINAAKIYRYKHTVSTI